MGRDKALLEFSGETLVERAVRKLGKVCSEVGIAGGGDALRMYGRVVPDGTGGCGPLGGIVAALETTFCDWSLFLAVDVPLVPAELLRRLGERCLESSGVAVMVRVEGRAEPLCAGYNRRALEVLRAELAAGHWKVTQAIAAAGAVEYLEVSGMETEWLMNVNTPEEFRVAERRAADVGI